MWGEMPVPESRVEKFRLHFIWPNFWTEWNGNNVALNAESSIESVLKDIEGHIIHKVFVLSSAYIVMIAWPLCCERFCGAEFGQLIQKKDCHKKTSLLTENSCPHCRIKSCPIF